MVEKKPAVAFALSLIGLALQAVGATFFAYMMFYGWGFGSWGQGMMMGPMMMGPMMMGPMMMGPMMMGPMMMGGPWSAGLLWPPLSAVFALIAMALGVLGVLWMNTAALGRVRTGSTLVLIASIIAFPTMFGFMLGSLLMLVGGILGLTWHPAVTEGGGS